MARTHVSECAAVQTPTVLLTALDLPVVLWLHEDGVADGCLDGPPLPDLIPPLCRDGMHCREIRLLLFPFTWIKEHAGIFYFVFFFYVCGLKS